MIMVAALYIFGVNSIQIFTLPLIVGIIAVHSALYLSQPALLDAFSDELQKAKTPEAKKQISNESVF